MANEVNEKVIVSVDVIDNFTKASANVNFWRKALKDAQADSKTTQKDLNDIARELAKANNEYRNAKKAIEGAAKTEELLDVATKKTTKTLGEMQRELSALRNTPLDMLSDGDAQKVRQKMADLMADIQDMKNEIKGLDTGQFWANMAQGAQAFSAGLTTVTSALSAVGVDSDIIERLNKNMATLIATTQALGVMTEYLSKKKSALIAANIRATVTTWAEIAATKASTAAANGNIVATKVWTVVQTVLNGALGLTAVQLLLILAPLALLIAGIVLFKNVFSASARAQKEATKANKEYEDQVSKTSAAVEAINITEKDAIEKKRQQYQQEILDLRKNGASKEAIAEKELEMQAALTDITIDASKQRENALKEEQVKAEKNIAAQQKVLANLLESKGEENKKYQEQLKLVNDLTASKMQLVGAINSEINAQKQAGLDLATATQDNADQQTSAAGNARQKAQDNYFKTLDLQQKFNEAQLKAERKFRKDLSKTNSENADAEFAAQAQYNLRLFSLQQKSETERLAAQRKFGQITQKEYEKELEILNLSAVEFADAQTKELEDFYTNRRQEILGMLDKGVDAQIKDLTRDYAAAIKDIGRDGKLNADEVAFYTAALEVERNKKIEEIRDNATSKQISEIEKKWSKAYQDDLAMFSDNEIKKLEKEIEMIQKVIEEKRKAGISTYEDEAKLRAQQTQLNQANLNVELVQAGHNADEQYKLKRAALEAEMKIYQGNAGMQAEIMGQLNDLDQQYSDQKIARAQQWADQTMAGLNALNGFVNALGEQQAQQDQEKYDQDKARLDDQFTKKLISQEQYDKSVAQLDAELDKKKKKLEREAAIRQKAISVTQAIINTALAVTSALSTQPFLPLGPIMAGIAASMGAIEIATIVSQPLPKARRGGLIMGNSHEAGGVLIEAEGGERIVNKRASMAFPELIDLMNIMGNSGRIPDGGYAARMLAPAYGASRSDQVAQQQDNLAERIGDQIKGINIYTSIEDVQKGDKKYVSVTLPGVA